MDKRHVTMEIPTHQASCVSIEECNSLQDAGLIAKGATCLQCTNNIPNQTGEQQQQQHQHDQQQQQHKHSPHRQHDTNQQLQQYWLQTQGVQQSVHDLASYADNIASANAKSALDLQQATWHKNQQLQVLVKQQSVRLQQQAAELEVLHGRASQSAQHHAQQAVSQPQTGPCITSAPWDAYLQQQLDWQKAEVAAWYRKFSREHDARQLAESALQSTLAIVDQLEQECDNISGMLRDVVVVEAAAAPAAEVKKDWQPALGVKTTRLGLALQLGAATFVAGCAGVASAYIALGIRGC